MTGQDCRDTAFGLASIVTAMFGWLWLAVTLLSTSATSGGSKRGISAIFAVGLGLAFCGARCIDSRSVGTKVAVGVGLLANAFSYSLWAM